MQRKNIYVTRKTLKLPAETRRKGGRDERLRIIINVIY